MVKTKKLTGEERKKVEQQISALQASLEEEAEAGTPAEEAAAEAEVEEQRQKLAALFDRLQITEEDWDLLQGTFVTEERTRRIVREELAAEEEAAEGGSLAEAGEKGAAATAVETDKKPQSPPGSQHWTARKLWGKDEEKPPGSEAAS